MGEYIRGETSRGEMSYIRHMSEVAIKLANCLYLMTYTYLLSPSRKDGGFTHWRHPSLSLFVCRLKCLLTSRTSGVPRVYSPMKT